MDGDNFAAKDPKPLTSSSFAKLQKCFQPRKNTMSSEPIVKKTYAESKEGTLPIPPDARGAPNILWILLDDVGFGASSAFGGLCKTPNFDKLAAKKILSSTQATTSEPYRL